MLKNVPLEKINVTKNAFLFLSRAPPVRRSFTVDSRFSYNPNIKFVSLEMCLGFSIFDFTFFFKLKFMFLFNKMLGLFDFKTS